MAMANQRISEYVLDAKVGAGTFGQVWRAHHHVWIDQLVAIKIPTDTQYVHNLQREGVAIHGLVHPNIVRAIGFDPYGDPPYLVMEYVPGTSLRPLIAAKSLTPANAVAILRQVLTGLEYAHVHRIIHRDVKPENILIHQRCAAEGYNLDGAVKVTDFGLGQAVNATVAGSIVYSASLNNAGNEVAGSLDYMAPEQRAGGDVDARADLYACGVMLYEMLTGERPAGTDVPSDLNANVPKALDEVFKRSYARLEKRYASAREFADALARAASLPVSPPLSSVAPVSSPVSPALLQPSMRPLERVWEQDAGHRSTLVACPKCRQPVDSLDQFCMHCGVQLVTEVRRCPRCGAFPEASDHYCIFCGQGLTEGVTKKASA